MDPRNMLDTAVQGFAESVVTCQEYSSHGGSEDVIVDSFLQAFGSLTAFLRTLGTAFYFVESDINEKIEIIKKNQAELGDNPKSEHILNLVQMEVDNGTVQSKNSSGRYILKLLRALKFVYLFFEELGKDQDLKVSAETAYRASLYNYQGWAVRKTVGLAFYMLPTREKFIKILTSDEEHVSELTGPLVETVKKVYTILNNYYETKHLQELS